MDQFETNLICQLIKVYNMFVSALQKLTKTSKLFLGCQYLKLVRTLIDTTS